MRTRLDLLLISALAVYRLWRLLARDGLTAKWRERLYNRWPPTASRATGIMKWDPTLRQNVFHARPRLEGDDSSRPKVSLVAMWADCPWCLGAWLAAVATIAVNESFGLTWPVAWFLAVSALVGLLGQLDAKSATNGSQVSA